MEEHSSFKIISFLGRPGSGKGTQAKLICEKFPQFQHISTGALLRERTKTQDFLGKKILETLEAGSIVPTPVVFMLWMPVLQELRTQTAYKGLLLDGSPRKVYEAKMLDEVMEMFAWKGNLRVLNIEISEQEAMTRLLKRGRSDDEKEDIENRLKWHHTQVNPTIEYYREQGVLIDIAGEQSPEEVHEEILSKLSSFL